VSTPTGEDPGGGNFAKYARGDGASLLRPVPSGSPSPSGKKKCPLGPDSPRRDKRCLDGAGGSPREVPEASMREGESECPSRRGIRWCRAIMSLACDVEQRGFHGRRLLRGKIQVGATSPSMHAATARAYFAQYHRVPLLLREKKVSRKIVIVRSSLNLRRGIPWCWANVSVACCRTKYAVGTARAYFAKYHRVPLLLREKKSVHLAPTLLRERSGHLTVGRGLRAESQRLL